MDIDKYDLRIKVALPEGAGELLPAALEFADGCVVRYTVHALGVFAVGVIISCIAFAVIERQSPPLAPAAGVFCWFVGAWFIVRRLSVICVSSVFCAFISACCPYPVDIASFIACNIYAMYVISIVPMWVKYRTEKAVTLFFEEAVDKDE